ncbi:MAG TPA: exodeoxyribonuclease III [Alphaproteobacteria bacterium]|nr:exodeoxyribonuclease III [Alphaproteobacteria bacterium]
MNEKSISITSWNINSIRAHLPQLTNWLQQKRPDVVLLQEIKCLELQFPTQEIEELGYNLCIVGQKTYNGVAVLSKFPVQIEHDKLPGLPADDQARYLEVIVEAKKSVWRIANVYVPNGNPYPGDKFDYKLRWLDCLCTHAQNILSYEEKTIIGGDFNIAPQDFDVYDPAGWQNDALCRPESRQFYRQLLHLGYSDALRLLYPKDQIYTFWDYQGGCWPRNAGLRIDHLLLSPQAADVLKDVQVDKYLRADDKPSDHVAIVGKFGDYSNIPNITMHSAPH